jgi:hypothetical protein
MNDLLKKNTESTFPVFLNNTKTGLSELSAMHKTTPVVQSDEIFGSGQ